jgi:hypothetical protein
MHRDGVGSYSRGHAIAAAPLTSVRPGVACARTDEFHSRARSCLVSEKTRGGLSDAAEEPQRDRPRGQRRHRLRGRASVRAGRRRGAPHRTHESHARGRCPPHQGRGRGRARGCSRRGGPGCGRATRRSGGSSHRRHRRVLQRKFYDDVQGRPLGDMPVADVMQPIVKTARRPSPWPRPPRDTW